MVFLAKIEKSKAFHHVSKEVPDKAQPPVNETLTIHDGNATFYYMREVPGNFKLICLKIFDMMSKGDVVFSTDLYIPGSIKSMERQRRGNTDKLIVRGENTKKPPDWKAFLCNDENKKQFIDLLVKEWSKDEYAPKLHGRQVIIICNGTANLLTSQDGHTTEKVMIDGLQSSQEESDTRVILYIKYALSKGYRYSRIKSPDTDIFFILLHYIPQLEGITVLFDTGTGNHQRLLNMTELANANTPEYCTSLMAMHAYSGCDTTFYQRDRKGKAY